MVSRLDDQFGRLQVALGRAGVTERSNDSTPSWSDGPSPCGTGTGLALYRLYEGDELYDRRRDPHETTNLVGDPTLQPTRLARRDEVLRWMVATSDVIRPERGPAHGARPVRPVPRRHPITSPRDRARRRPVTNPEALVASAGAGLVARRLSPRRPVS